MTSERKTGLAPLPMGLLRPTTPPEPPPAIEPSAGPELSPEGAEGQGGPSPAKPRRRRPPAEGETRGRKLHLPDSIHDRLWLQARQRRKSVSAVASEILDRALPRFRVERDG